MGAGRGAPGSRSDGVVQIFISYAREDRPLADALAAELTTAGHTVWYDRFLTPGVFYVSQINEALERADRVIVLWTARSLRSEAVAREVHFASGEGVLVPLLLEDAPLPPLERATQYVKTPRWGETIEPEALSQILDAVEAPSGADDPADDQAPWAPDGPERPGQERPGQERPGAAAPAAPRASPGLAAVAPAMFALFVASSFALGYWSALIALAGLTLVGGLLIELRAGRLSRSLMRRWFAPAPSDMRFAVSSGEAVSYCFDAVYGRRHLSARCVIASLIGSACAFFAMLYSFSSYENVVGYFEIRATTPDGAYDPLAAGRIALNTALLFVITNGVGDYISLYQTRVLLWAARGPNAPAIFFATVDVIFSVIVFLIFQFIALIALLFSQAAMTPDIDLADAASCATTFSETGCAAVLASFQDGAGADVLRDFSERIWTGEPLSYFGAFLFASMITALLSTVWILVAVVFVRPVQRVLWRDRSEPSALGRLLQVRRQPFAAFGIAAGGFIAAATALAWSATALAG